MTELREHFTILLNAWAEAIVANDPTRIRSFTAPGWIMVGDTGIIEGTAFLDAVAAGHVTHSWMTFEVHRARRDGDVVTVVARGRNHGAFNDVRFELDEWVTEIFIRHGDTWLCTLTHLTPVREES